VTHRPSARNDSRDTRERNGDEPHRAFQALFESTATEVVEKPFKNISEGTVISELGIDSLGMLEIVGAMERKLKMSDPGRAARGHPDGSPAPRAGRASGDGQVSTDDLREKLRAIIAEVSEVDEIPDATPFKDLGIDSMMAIEIVAEIERTYKLSVPENELQRITNLDSVYALVKEKLPA
jgi:acyl carrier protein